MTDEKYTFVSDVIDKKQTARSARSRRTHTGKGGRAKLPSDYMTKKELEAMNGECKTYRMNSPMKWAEFKAMPDELKIDYIKSILEKYHAPASAVADMLGIHRTALYPEYRRLGLEVGQKGWKPDFDKEGFLAWANGVPVQKAEAPQDVPVEVPQVEEQKAAPAIHGESCRLVPNSGTMVFEGKVDEVLKTVAVLLGGANVHISITWDVLEGADNDK